MVDTVKTLLGQNAKAVAAFLTTALVGVVSQVVDVPQDVQTAFQAFVVTALVWAVSNTPAKKG